MQYEFSPEEIAEMQAHELARTEDPLLKRAIVEQHAINNRLRGFSAILNLTDPKEQQSSNNAQVVKPETNPETKPEN